MASHPSRMSETADASLSAFDDCVPTDREHTVVDVSAAPPPKPLTRTLRILADLDDDEILLQVNDREPTHLYPKLDERGAAYATVERGTSVLTAVWKP
ncbi:hypothetical protein C2R22_12215 [Salinigranum rubrum]|uniref:DUF2249 domain-containing protein n=2 Tax=Salinigranum rubrum TaxID=755307 RepID=A0A2I8VPW8_9EURY|nr:hypothetical protein C2R22_12215 [Salinigranum rubrum]